MKLTAKDIPQAITQYIQTRMIGGRQLITRHLQSLIKTANIEDLPKRPLLVELQHYLNEFLKNQSTPSRWLVVSGLRGAGKTTLLGQLYLESVALTAKQKIDKLFISLDEVSQLQADLGQTLEAYQSLLGRDLADSQRPILLFIDEIQADPNWALVLKILYDRCPNIFIFCTGSSATAQQMNADTYGRRAIVKKLYPLSLIEFFEFHRQIKPDLDLAQTLRNCLYYSESPKQLYKQLLALEKKINQRWSLYDRRLLNKYLCDRHHPLCP